MDEKSKKVRHVKMWVRARLHLERQGFTWRVPSKTIDALI
jgi:hypothetical protein